MVVKICSLLLFTCHVYLLQYTFPQANFVMSTRESLIYTQKKRIYKSVNILIFRRRVSTKLSSIVTLRNATDPTVIQQQTVVIIFSSSAAISSLTGAGVRCLMAPLFKTHFSQTCQVAIAVSQRRIQHDRLFLCLHDSVQHCLCVMCDRYYSVHVEYIVKIKGTAFKKNS